jgi:hypothetical protein
VSIDLGEILLRAERYELEIMIKAAGSPAWDGSDDNQKRLLVLAYMLGQMSSVIGPGRMSEIVAKTQIKLETGHGTG